MGVRRTVFGGAVVAVILIGGACSSSEELAADAGADFEVVVGDAPAFDGCGSTGDIESYSWIIVEAPAAMADDAGKEIKVDDPSCSYQLEDTMELGEVGTWVIELTVDDGEATATDLVTVEVTEP